MAAILRLLLSNRTGESVLLNVAGSRCGPFLRRAKEQSGFNDPLWRMQRDHAARDIALTTAKNVNARTAMLRQPKKVNAGCCVSVLAGGNQRRGVHGVGVLLCFRAGRGRDHPNQALSLTKLLPGAAAGTLAKGTMNLKRGLCHVFEAARRIQRCASERV